MHSRFVETRNHFAALHKLSEILLLLRTFAPLRLQMSENYESVTLARRSLRAVETPTVARPSRAVTLVIVIGSPGVLS